MRTMLPQKSGAFYTDITIKTNFFMTKMTSMDT